MENASKALLIAGAILLVIAVIAIAMGVLNMGGDSTEEIAESMKSLEVQAFNKAITPYLDVNLTATTYSEVKSAAASIGIDVSSMPSWEEVSKKVYNASYESTGKVQVVACNYLTRTDIKNNLVNALTGNKYTEEDIGKIVAIKLKYQNRHKTTGNTNWYSYSSDSYSVAPGYY